MRFKKRRDRGGHACDPVVAAAWSDKTQGRGKDRARFDEARAARALDRLESLAHLARPPPLLCAKAGLQSVRSFQVMSQRQSFPANRPGAETGCRLMAALFEWPSRSDQYDPLLGPLQDNGGPTLTHMPLPGSPAIDAGDPNFTPPPLRDQRGPCFHRVFRRLDIGSVETQPERPCPTPRPRPTPPR